MNKQDVVRYCYAQAAIYSQLEYECIGTLYKGINHDAARTWRAIARDVLSMVDVPLARVAVEGDI